MNIVYPFNLRVTGIKITLTTDASDVAIGAVLSQNGNPITFISKTLNKTEKKITLPTKNNV